MTERYHSLREAIQNYHASETVRAISNAQALIERVSNTRLRTQAHIEETRRLMNETRQVLLEMRPHIR